LGIDWIEFVVGDDRTELVVGDRSDRSLGPNGSGLVSIRPSWTSSGLVLGVWCLKEHVIGRSSCWRREPNAADASSATNRPDLPSSRLVPADPNFGPIRPNIGHVDHQLQTRSDHLRRLTLAPSSPTSIQSAPTSATLPRSVAQGKRPFSHAFSRSNGCTVQVQPLPYTHPPWPPSTTEIETDV